jgi:glycosyltransferase involved in cell wall biosynthesis
MIRSKPVVQIGPVSDDPAESVSCVNQALISGISDQYEFIASSANRHHGNTRQGRFNLWNLYYVFKHSAIWFWNLVRYRPAVAHYAISSGLALEKGLIFLGGARLLGARTVGHLHSGAFIDYWNKLPEARRKRAVRQLSRLDAFVVLSERWRTIVAEQVGIPLDRIFVVNNPIDRHFEESALAFPATRPATILLSLGVMGKDKGVLDLVKAAGIVHQKIPHFRLQLAGPEREPGILAQVKAEIGKGSLGDCIEILPSVWGEAKLDIFRSASVFLLPSYYENFPLVVLEAAAAGQAIISTPVGATPEFFEDQVSALFVPPRHPEALAEAILRLLEQPEERLRLGKAARAVFCGKLSRRQIVDSLKMVYDHVLF